MSDARSLFQKPPTDEAEQFLGSSTVLVDGEPHSSAMQLTLSCQD